MATTIEIDPYKDKKQLAAFCKGWKMAGRGLQTASGTYPQIRELYRSDRRIVIHTCARGYEHPPMQLTTYDDEAAATAAFAALIKKPPAGFKATDSFYVTGRRGGTWVRRYAKGHGWVCGNKMWFGAFNQTPNELADHEAAVAAFDEAESASLARGIVSSYLETDDDMRPDDDVLLHAWMENRERSDTEPAGWHLGAIAAIHAAFAKSFTAKQVEISVAPPASVKDIAAYAETLPTGLSEDLRAAWLVTGSVGWRVGTSEGRFLSPKQILQERAAQRAGLTTRFGELKKGAKPDQWLAKKLDPIVVGSDGCLVAYDTECANVKPKRASNGEVFYQTDQGSLDYKKPTVYPSTLAYTLAEGFASNFVDALVATFPAIKKTKYGQRAK